MTKKNSKTLIGKNKPFSNVEMGDISPSSIDRKYSGAHSRPDQLYVARRGEDIPALLYDLLSHATPHGTEGAIQKLLPTGHHKKVDKMGNVLYFIGKNAKHKTMFSCHMDTVHRKPHILHPLFCQDGMIWGSLREYTKMTTKSKDKAGKKVSVTKKKYTYDENILGADDKVGCYIMCCMMEAKIPGLYVFHAGEERGGLGSAYLAKEHVETFKNIERCIAFDRKAYTSVITKQGGSRCCSETFAKGIIAEFDKYMPKEIGFQTDTGGSFTDSKNYTDIIGECTNLSVGYFNQHMKTEHFDPIWLTEMFIPACFKVDWANLPTERKPGEVEKHIPYKYPERGSSYQGSAYETNYLNPHTPATRIPPFTEFFLEKVASGVTKHGVETMVRHEIMTHGMDKIEKLLIKIIPVYFDNQVELQLYGEQIEELESLLEDINLSPEELALIKLNRELTQQITDLQSKLDEKAWETMGYGV